MFDSSCAITCLTCPCCLPQNPTCGMLALQWATILQPRGTTSSATCSRKILQQPIPADPTPGAPPLRRPLCPKRAHCTLRHRSWLQKARNGARMSIWAVPPAVTPQLCNAGMTRGSRPTAVSKVIPPLTPPNLNPRTHQKGIAYRDWQAGRYFGMCDLAPSLLLRLWLACALWTPERGMNLNDSSHFW